MSLVAAKMQEVLNALDTEREYLERRMEVNEQKRQLVEELLELTSEDDEEADEEGSGTRMPPPTSRPQPPRPSPRPPQRMRAPVEQDADEEPVRCGQGAREPREGSNLELLVSALRGRAPHWLSTAGIVEAIDALGLRRKDDMPRHMATTLNGVLKDVRENKVKVPGCWYKKEGSRYLYRVTIGDIGDVEAPD